MVPALIRSVRPSIRPTLGLVAAALLAIGLARPLAGADLPDSPPRIEPALLFFSIVGGPGDQWFPEVRVTGTRIQAVMGGKLGAAVEVQDGDQVVARIVGDPNATDDVSRDLPNGGKLGPYTYGYKQVHAILQQPFLSGGGLDLWGWSYDEAKNAKVRYGAMADSRIRALWSTPQKTLLAVGSADGGNPILRAHPKDRNQTLSTAFDAGGGGGGKSSWVIEVQATTGDPLHVIACRGTVTCHAYDAWNRLILAGQAVNKHGEATALGYRDGAGILMTDADWSGRLFAAHLGARDGDSGINGMAWSLDLDSTSGLLAVSGWMEGSPQGVNAVQKTPGGGKDAFLAVIRLWSAQAPAGKRRR